MKYIVSAMLVLCLIVVMAGAATAVQGTWKSYAIDSLGQLSATDSQSAYVTSARGGPETKVTGLEWTIMSVDPKARDYSSTTTDGGATVWNIADGDANYQKTYITPSSFDSSRGIVMAKIRVINAMNLNGTFGFSTSSGYGMQLALRGNSQQARVRGGDGGSIYADPANFDQLRYRVYALSWVGTAANVWYSNTTDWSGASTDWTLVGSYTMPASSGTSINNNGATPWVSGIALTGWGGSNTWNGNIEWIAHNTYDNISGEMTPWDFNPAIQPVPEPGSMLALASGLVGMAGFALRRRRA